jgi:hypothetical protein
MRVHWLGTITDAALFSNAWLLLSGRQCVTEGGIEGQKASQLQKMYN